jgi:hypothetical protein
MSAPPILAVLCVISLVSSPFMLWYDYNELLEKRHIEQDGIETSATATTKVDRNSSLHGHSYFLDVEYAAEGVSSRKTRVEISNELYSKIDAAPTLHVRYLRSNPQRLIVVGQPLQRKPFYLDALFSFMVGSVGTWLTVVRKILAARKQVGNT